MAGFAAAFVTGAAEAGVAIGLAALAAEGFTASVDDTAAGFASSAAGLVSGALLVATAAAAARATGLGARFAVVATFAEALAATPEPVLAGDAPWRVGFCLAFAAVPDAFMPDTSILRLLAIFGATPSAAWRAASPSRPNGSHLWDSNAAGARLAPLSSPVTLI
ncbi:MAG TPA: hypothetical protein VMB34_15145 [Acetobacteraceae bacterium]|nr:hypothetical protein [Acetobacteraceae bacterium]